MRNTKTMFIDSMEKNDQESILKSLWLLNLSHDDIEKAMGSRLCDLEDTIDIKKYIESDSKKYVDENGLMYTTEELIVDYDELVFNGNTESETFEDYLENCTSKNGTLTEV